VCLVLVRACGAWFLELGGDEGNSQTIPPMGLVSEREERGADAWQRKEDYKVIKKQKDRK